MTDVRAPSGTTPIAPSESLRRGATWSLVGNVVYAAGQWVALILIARLGDARMVGQFGLGLTIATPIMILASLQLRSVLSTDVRHEFPFRRYLTLRVLSAAVAVGVTALVTVLLGYGGTTAAVILIVSVGKSLDAVSDIIYGLFQRERRLRAVSVGLMTNGVISMLGTAIGVLATGSAVGAAIGWSLASAVTLVGPNLAALRAMGGSTTAAQVAGLRSSLTSEPGSEPKRMARLVVTALPLGVASVMLTLNASIPRLVLEDAVDVDTVGVWVAVSYAGIAGTFVVTALGQSASARLAAHYATGDRRGYLRLLGLLLGLASLVGLAGIAVSATIGGWLLGVVYSDDYAGYGHILTWTMVGALLGYLGALLGYAVTAQRRFTSLYTPYVATTIVTALAAVVLIPRHGLEGAAWVSVVTGLSVVLGSAILVVQGVKETTRDGHHQHQPA